MTILNVETGREKLRDLVPIVSRHNFVIYLFSSPFNLSVVFSARPIGPTLGYTLASACLSIYVDPGNIPPGIDEDHPRYIGAWWIGFIVIAVLLMIFAPWLTLFPSVLPSKVFC